MPPQLWFQHMFKVLKEEGLKWSKHNACLLMKKVMLVICRVDDLGIQLPSIDIVNKLIESLHSPMVLN